MIATLEYVEILDEAEALGQMILQSEEMKKYEEAKYSLDVDKEAQMRIQAFNDIKEHYEDVQRFGRYHPDYNQIMRDVRKVKREMDMDEKVAQFKVAERQLQGLLDEICGILARNVSEQIKSPVSGAALTDSGCGCGSGGSCGCQAS
ncbi:MAG TPA: YlbF family regulator [Candidatus Avamphibacillus intestinigallinarum]|nr:YlbF family regulator [Candidatus Avamphibacillus intestinigallinarum]